ncbi:MAG: NAD(P)/FAD-dependent oxidoreductase [Candidatus Neomarinimicrobiota bacterium]
MYDAIIVGAGPSGTTAALYAHRFGLKCILLDKASFPRDKICGDALSGKSVRLLRELDLIKGVENLNGSDINRITFGGPSHNKFDVHLNGDDYNYRNRTKGYVIPRFIFDNFLFEEADRVTDTRQGFTVTNLLFDNDLLSGVKGINAEGQEENFFAPIILGCDGPNSIVSRKLGLYKMDMDNTAVAIRCYYEGVEGLTDQIELHYVPEVKPGYFWLFPAGEGKANIGIGLSKNDAKKENRTLKQIMDQIIHSDYFKDRFSNARALEKPKGWNLPMGSVRRKNHGDGFMLLGDAAGLVDPFTGEGIGNAMVSAKHAMEIVKKAKDIGDYSINILKEYDELVWNEIGGELRTSTKLQKLARFSFLLNFVIDRAARNEEVQEIISGMLSNQKSRNELSNPMFYFKILFS